MEQKPFYLSRTFWVNALSFAVLALSLPEVGGLVPEGAIRYVAAFNAVANLYLRFEKPKVD